MVLSPWERGKLATFLEDTVKRRNAAGWARDRQQMATARTTNTDSSKEPSEDGETSDYDSGDELPGHITQTQDTDFGFDRNNVDRETREILRDEDPDGFGEEPEEDIREGTDSEPELQFIDG